MGKPRHRAPVSCAALGMVALLLATAAFGAPPWKLMRTPRFVLVAQLSEPAARAWATEFNQFVDALRTQVRIEEARLPPLTVVVFAEARHFAPYRVSRPAGGARDIAGLFSSRETWSVIGLAAPFDQPNSRQTVFHEATHWAAAGTAAHMPVWLNEGLAEVFSTFEMAGGTTRWGRTIESHIVLLQGSSQLPLAELLLVGPRDPLFNDAARTRLFYAKSWAFVHYLIFGVRAGDARALDRFLNATTNGVAPGPAFRDAFGLDPAGMDRELATYLEQGKYRTHSRTTPLASVVAAPYLPAAPAEVETALARLALGSNHPDLAYQHVTRAVALVPEEPGPYEVLAFLRADEDDTEAARVSARRAIDLGSRDAWMHVLDARGLHHQAYADGTLDGAVARQVADGYRRALDLRPDLQHALASLGRLLDSVETVADDDLRHLRRGRQLYPDDGEILLGLASAAHRTGDEAEAQALLARLRDPGGPFPPEVRTRAAAVGVQWEVAVRQARISLLLRQGRKGDALAEYTGLLALPLPVEMHASFSLQRDLLIGRGKLDAARAALAAERLAEARSLLEEIMAMPRIPRPLVNSARELLEHVEARQRPPVR